MSDDTQNINPNFRKIQFPEYDLETCLIGISNGDRNILSYLISKSESHLDEDQKFISKVLADSSDSANCKVIAVTGAPGVGKSTFINSFGKKLISEGNRIAVLPVDPTSQISKGSILGDKTRMDDISFEDGAFIKPMSSALSLGGVAPGTSLAIEICRRAGFNYIFIETVGVGQSEYEVRYLVDCMVLLLLPGGGDDLQGIKRGIMEMADIIAINKADGELLEKANSSLNYLNGAMKLMSPNQYGWVPATLLYSSLGGDDNLEMTSALNQFYEYMDEDNRLDKLRLTNKLRTFDHYINRIILDYVTQTNNLYKEIDHNRNLIKSNQLNIFEALLKFKTRLYQG